MNIIFLTYGLTPRNTRLMPWRYVLEIAKGIMLTGNSTAVVTDGAFEGLQFPLELPPVEMVNGPFTINNPLYRNCIEEIKHDVIFVPVARRSIISEKTTYIDGIAHCAYFPSPWYDAKPVWKVCGELPFHDACVYALESVIPGNWLVKRLKRKNILGIVTVTDHTAKQLIKSGWPESRVKAFAPGVDLLRNGNGKSDVYDQWLPKMRIKGSKYLLFMGPPAAIRGVYFLLKTFDRVAGSLNNVVLVCLLRQSEHAETERFKKAVREMRHCDRVVVIEEKLTEDDVAAFIKASRVVILPFLIIPSEIPLTVIEAMAFGKPVIITETGGTSQFIGKAGIVVPQNDTVALAESIKDIFLNEKAYLAMCEEAGKIIKKQLPWKDVAQSVLDFTTEVLSTGRAM